MILYFLKGTKLFVIPKIEGEHFIKRITAIFFIAYIVAFIVHVQVKPTLAETFGTTFLMLLIYVPLIVLQILLLGFFITPALKKKNWKL